MIVKFLFVINQKIWQPICHQEERLIMWIVDGGDVFVWPQCGCFLLVQSAAI
uniref:Uncharacterized protein n=1 Tax=Nelumbo nucifera TaxID=4432 RepID=A0A822Z566_NELNU|nr:TPA_asm: hypothetical protein HUJ06_014026 [Nelumbo nucifera]